MAAADKLPDHPRTLRAAEELVRAGLLPDAEAAAAARVAEVLPIAVPPALLPLLAEPALRRQFVPSAAELEAAADDLADPIGDDAHSPLPGIVHRYPDRVLLKPLLACPVYCRFCFRRDAVGPDGGALTPKQIDAAIAYVAARPEIFEVILSGGEPLLLAPAKLRALLERLRAIPHVAVLRIHTRLPIAAPERVTPALLAALGEPPPWLVVHCNHAAELAPPQVEALARLRRAGVPLLAQSVLLRGVNDDVAVLEALMRALVRAGVKPYYLHHPDLVPGTAHFRLSLAEGQRLVAGLRGRLSGIAQPTYVLDIPGGYGKVPAGMTHVDAETGRVIDTKGRGRAYSQHGA